MSWGRPDLETGAPSAEESGAAHVVVVRDTSDRDRIIEVATQRERLATVGEVTARVLHELATPLTGVSTLVADLVAAANGSDPSTLLLIQQETERASEIVRELLAFVRRDGDASSASLNEAVERALRLSELRHPDDDVEVVTDLSTSAPHVVASLGRLQQVVFNLVENAKYAVRERGQGNVTVRTRRVGGEVVLEVIDTGSGIPKEIRERVFEPFFTTKDSGIGTGLGLSIVQGIVKDFGGSIGLESNGWGTIFIVALQAADED